MEVVLLSSLRCLLILLVFSFLHTDQAWSMDVHLESRVALLMSADTGAVLYEKDGYGQRDPASITKVATAMYALKHAADRLDTLVVAEQDLVGWVSVDKKKQSNYTLPPYWLEPGAMHISIKVGERVSLMDLLYGMMLASGDECSNMVAHGVSGSVTAFMAELNEYLKEELGCQRTTFSNPHGLFHPQHKTTAFDMAVITREALKDPLFRKIVKTLEYKRHTDDPSVAPIWQTNRLIKPGKHYYPKAIGVKTGYISVAQRNLIAAAEDGGRTLIAVLMGCSERGAVFQDAIKLFDAAFAEPRLERCFLPKGQQRFSLNLDGSAGALHTYTGADLSVFFYRSDGTDSNKWRCLLEWDQLTLPIAKDQQVGKVTLVNEEGRRVDSVELYAASEVNTSWQANITHTLQQQAGPLLKGGALACVMILLGGMALHLRRKSNP